MKQITNFQERYLVNKGFILKIVAALILLFIISGDNFLNAQNQTFQAGASLSNITPPLGKEIVGGWNSPPATYIHDQLYAKTLILDDGRTRLALVWADNVSNTREA